MKSLTLIGIGTGNPEHLTEQARTAIAKADLILVPDKGDGKSNLSSLRMHLISAILHALSRLCEHAHKRTQARVVAWVVLCAQLLELDASREILGPACARLTEDALAATRRDAMQTEALDPVACAQRLASQQFLQD